MTENNPHIDKPWPPVRLRSAVFIERDGKVLLLLDPIYRGGCWTLPGGGVEFNETYIQAAKREVFEETGLSVQINGLWRIREIWEPETDYPDQNQVRKSLELIFIGEFVDGDVNIFSNPSNKADGKRRVTDYYWFPLNSLDTTINNLPIYPAELFHLPRPLYIKGTAIDSVILPPIDLRGDE